MRPGRFHPALALALLVWAGCERETENIDVFGDELVWQDEFDGAAGQAPDPAKWTHDTGTNWGNNQLEYDTDRTQNAALDGQGNLLITARRENWQGCAYTSARLVTRGLHEVEYGRIEARIQLPSGQGIWPAFWLLGANIGTVGWPACGEIDILESRGQEPTALYQSLHGPGYSGGNSVTRRVDRAPVRLDQDFHVYAVEWHSHTMRWLVDGVATFEVEADDLPGDWVYDHPHYLILNLAVGGNFVGPPNASTVFPQTLKVDWVRVYQ